MYASTPSRPGVAAMCPVLSDGRIGTPISLDLRGALLKSDTRRYSVTADETESEAESALDFFLNHISEPSCRRSASTAMSKAACRAIPG